MQTQTTQSPQGCKRTNKPSPPQAIWIRLELACELCSMSIRTVQRKATAGMYSKSVIRKQSDGLWYAHRETIERDGIQQIATPRKRGRKPASQKGNI